LAWKAALQYANSATANSVPPDRVELAFYPIKNAKGRWVSFFREFFLRRCPVSTQNAKNAQPSRWPGLPLVVAVTLMASAACSASARAGAPAAARLFPKSTVAFASIANAAEFRGKLLESSWGQMSQNPQLKPLADRLFGTLDKTFAAVEQQLGGSLRELLSIPQGEIAFAVVPQSNGPPAVALLLDAGERAVQADKVVQRAENSLEELGGARREESIGGVQLVIYEFGGGGDDAKEIAYFRKDGAICATNNVAMLKTLLDRWNATSSDALEQNPNFAAISRRCRPGEDERPQVLLYADPIALVRNMASDNAATRVGLALLPALGLDGLLGIGGSLSMATSQYDLVIHAHVLLENPRTGIPELFALRTGDMTPESWVPGDAAAYTTMRWDVDKTYRKAAKLADSFMGQGAFVRWVRDPLVERYGIDLEQEILPALAGRFTMVSLLERPARLGSQGMLLAASLKEPAKFQPTLEKLVAIEGTTATKKSYGGKDYFELQLRAAVGDGAGGGGAGGNGAVGGWQRPCCGILGDYLILADRPSFYEAAVATLGDSSKSLAASLDYKLIASKLSRQAANPSMISFSRPEQSLRYVYDLAASADTRKMLAERGESSPLLRDLGQALEENPLPPFSVLEQYLAPGGSALTDDESGLHYQSFTLRRERP
jgi:Protein of unknown function (DUF3352)